MGLGEKCSMSDELLLEQVTQYCLVHRVQVSNLIVYWDEYRHLTISKYVV